MLSLNLPDSSSIVVICDVVSTEGPGALKPRFIEGQEIPNWEAGLELEAFLMEMRQQGWSFSASSSGKVFVFTHPGRGLGLRSSD